MRKCGKQDFGSRRRRAFLVMDAVIAIVAALVLLTAITVTISQQARAERRLAESRAAARSLESAMLLLESGGRVPEEVRVELVAGPAPAGYAWVRVRGGGTRRGELVGLVQRKHIPAGVAETRAGNEGSR